jgi:plasmid stabilization system protein ParE
MASAWSIVLTPSAEDDLLAIGRYTETQWGTEQRDNYLRGIEETLEKIPLASVERGYWQPRLRSVTHQKQYYIIFRVIETEQKIQIYRILYTHRDIDKLFDSE